MARTKSEIATGVELKRIAIDAETAADLAHESKLYHIPAQDLVGGACRAMLKSDANLRQIWHRLAIQIREERLTTGK